MTARKNTNSKKSPAAKKIPHYSKHWFILFFLAVLVLAILVIKPFITTLLVAAVITYVLHPLYRRLARLFRNEPAAAGVIIALLLAVIIVPLGFLAAHVTKESYDIYLDFKDFYYNHEEGLCPDAAYAAGNDTALCGMYHAATAFTEERGIDLTAYLTTASGSVLTSLVKALTSFILNMPALLLHIFITLFIIFYLLVDGEKILKTLKEALPLKHEHSESIFTQFNDVIYATIYGAIIISIIQGVLALIGFVVFDAPSPIILGLLTIVFAFVPFLGTAMIWLPVSATMIISGASAADNTLVMKGLGLLVYGILVIATADNILRPKIVGDRAKIHPLLILLGVFGGIALFGFAGIIIGPLMLALFTTALRIYEQEKEHILKD